MIENSYRDSVIQCSLLLIANVSEWHLDHFFCVVEHPSYERVILTALGREKKKMEYEIF